MRWFARRRGEGKPSVPDDGTHARPCLACGNSYYDPSWDPNDRRTRKRPPICPDCFRTQEWLARERDAAQAETYFRPDERPSVRPSVAHAKRDPRIERTRRKHLLRELREARKTVEMVRKAGEPVGLALDDLRERFHEWMDDEDERMRTDLLDDLRVIYPDASEAELETTVRGFLPRRGRP